MSQDTKEDVNEQAVSRKDAMLNDPAKKPETVAVIAENIPIELREKPQWVGWRWEWRRKKKDQPDPLPGRWTKPPINALTGRYAAVDDPSTWCKVEDVMRAYLEGQLDGIGVVLRGGSGVDLDDCVAADGTVADWARQIIAELDTYGEFSPTGTGVKLYCFGALPPEGRRRGHVEMYDDSSARYFTLTGHHLLGTPTTVNERQKQLAAVHAEFIAENPAATEVPAAAGRSSSGNLDDEALLERGKRFKNGDKLKRLLAGDTSGHGGDQSRADLALCSMLVFLTNGDAARVDRLFRDSGLMRDKWDEKHYGNGDTYGEGTIAEALKGFAAGTGYDPSSYKASLPTTAKPVAPPPTVDLQGLKLVVTNARKTPSKIVATVTVEKDGVPIDALTVSTASSSRREAAKEIAKHLVEPDAVQIDMALAAVMTSARMMASMVAVREGATVKEIVAGNHHERPAAVLQDARGVLFGDPRP